MSSICPSSLTTLTENFLLLDIRERFEFNTDRADFPNYLNIPFSEFDEELPNLQRNRKLILICNNGLRSRTAVQFLAERGFTDVSSVMGGLVKWQQNGLPMTGTPPDFISHSLSDSKECSA